MWRGCIASPASHLGIKPVESGRRGSKHQLLSRICLDCAFIECCASSYGFACRAKRTGEIQNYHYAPHDNEPKELYFIPVDV